MLLTGFRHRSLAGITCVAAFQMENAIAFLRRFSASPLGHPRSDHGGPGRGQRPARPAAAFSRPDRCARECASLRGARVVSQGGRLDGRVISFHDSRSVARASRMDAMPGGQFVFVIPGEIIKASCAICKAQFSKVLPYYGFDMSMVGGVHQLVGRAIWLGELH